MILVFFFIFKGYIRLYSDTWWLLALASCQRMTENDIIHHWHKAKSLLKCSSQQQLRALICLAVSMPSEDWKPVRAAACLVSFSFAFLWRDQRSTKQKIPFIIWLHDGDKLICHWKNPGVIFKCISSTFSTDQVQLSHVENEHLPLLPFQPLIRAPHETVVGEKTARGKA